MTDAQRVCEHMKSQSVNSLMSVIRTALYIYKGLFDTLCYSPGINRILFLYIGAFTHFISLQWNSALMKPILFVKLKKNRSIDEWNADPHRLCDLLVSGFQ